MKKKLLVITLMIFILMISSIAFGANGIINVSMNGSRVQVKEVPVLMNGQAFISDVPSFIYVDRTLVPVRFVAEKLGAEVKWDQNTKTATVIQSDKEIKMTIDSTSVTVNNQVRNLDKNSIPKLVTFANNDARTMVPVRFVSEVLGYEVGWDENSNTPYINTPDEDIEVIDLDPDVTLPEEPKTPVNPSNPSDSSDAAINSVSAVKGSTSKHRVVIKADKAVEYDTLFLPDSNKLIIDIKNSYLNLSNVGEIKVNDENVKSIGYSQHGSGSRIVVELNSKAEYEIYSSQDGKTVTATFEENIFRGIYSDKINGRDALVIDGLGGANYKTLKLTSPERIVIDLLDTNLADQVYSYNINNGFIKGARVSQFSDASLYNVNDRIVRIVLDINETVKNPQVDISSDGGRLIITPQKSFWENISYDAGGSEKTIKITNNEKTRYDVQYYSGMKVLMVTIPASSSDLEVSDISIKDNFIEDISIAENNGDKVVTISFKREIIYNVLSDRSSGEIVLSMKRDPAFVSTDYTIVIDAGHGGKDPGAISPNGTKEKDVNLIIALKTRDLLESLGYNVIMTRTGDTYPGLYERSGMANSNNADIFVSIHHNSIANSEINGLEILYCPRDKGPRKTDEQYPLADAVLKGILSSTGGVDRGIRQRPDIIVTREADMPAILVEVGYLTNAQEEARILNDAHQNKVVSGLVSGIQNYFENN